MIPVGENNARSYNGALMKYGKNGEKLALDFLRNRPDVIGVDDTSDLKVLQEADVDCIIKTRDGLITLAEIKCDSHIGISDNVLFEVLRINHTCQAEHSVKLGWSSKTPARIIIYVNSETMKMYAITSDNLRKALQKYTQECRKKTRIDFVSTDEIKSTVNILIPKRYCSLVEYDLNDCLI
jgi:hypothetical protein